MPAKPFRAKPPDLFLHRKQKSGQITIEKKRGQWNLKIQTSLVEGFCPKQKKDMTKDALKKKNDSSSVKN
jgi:hypothetical protein